MTDLVTDAAIDAATYAIGLAPEGSEKLPFILTAAAPLIAAEALRQAGARIEAKYNHIADDPESGIMPLCYVLDGIDMAARVVAETSDELEGK